MISGYQFLLRDDYNCRDDDPLFVALGQAKAVYSDHEDVVRALRELADRETVIAGVDAVLREMAEVLGVQQPVENLVLGSSPENS